MANNKKIKIIKTENTNFSEQCLNTADIIIVALSLKGEITLINKKGYEVLGYKKDELIGKNWFRVCVPKNEREKVKKIFKEIVSNRIKKLKNYENPVITKKGEIKQILWRNTIIQNNKIKIIGTISCGVDVTESNKVDNNSIRVNRALRMVSSVNKLLITMTDEKTLLNEVCKVIIEMGGYRMAWVGFAQHDKEKSVLPVAHMGIEKRYIEKANLSWGDNLRGRGPGGTAIRKRKTIVIHDIKNDKRMAPWKKNALKRGYRSVIGLPLVHNKVAFGVILIYSRYINVFCDEEVKILNELADDLSFGINTQRIREEILKLKNAVETSGEVVYMTNSQGIITYINSEFSNLYGYNRDEVVNKVTPRILKSGFREPKEYKNLWNNLLKGKIVRDEHINKTKSGKFLIVESTVSPIFTKKDKIIGFLAIQRDVTENKKNEEKLKENEQLVSNVNSIMLKWKPDGKISFINNYGSKIFGYKKNELIGKSATVLVPKKESSGRDLTYLIKNITKHPKKYLFNENENIKKNGIRFWVAWTNRVIKDKKGNLVELLAVGSEISKLKKTEEELKESSNRFKNIFDYSAVGVSLLSIDGHWIEVNNALCKITGYYRKELINKNFNDITHPGDFKKGIEATKNLLTGKISHANYEKRYIHKKGHTVWVNLSIALVKDSNDNPLYFVTHTEDISYRKEVENKLIESEFFFKESQKAGFIGSYKTDFIKGFWESSDILDAIFGINKNYVKSIKGWSDLIHPEDRKMMNDYLEKEIILNHHKFNKEYRIISKSDGKVKWVNGLGKVFYDKNGKTISMIGTIQDITVRKEIENNLKIAEQKFRRLFEAAKDSILILDAETGEITDSNPFIQDLLGYLDKELIGKKIYEISPFKDIIENKEKFLELQNKGYVYYDNLPLKTKSGIIKQVEFVSNLYLVGSKKVIQCNIRDITERIKKEKELEVAKSDFLSMTSHQLRTPLSATKWVLEAFNHDENFTAKQKERFGYLVDSNERLINLVNDLLDVTRIESGKLIVNKKLTDLNKLIKDLSLSLKVLADKKNKNIKISAPKELKNVICDPVLIHEALQNLLNNAIIYSKEDSNDIQISISERRDDYLISIHNDGFIDPVSAERISIFGKFTRGIGASEIQPAGSGLGLYITKKVIEASGGNVWFESSAERGTTFYLTIIKSRLKK